MPPIREIMLRQLSIDLKWSWLLLACLSMGCSPLYVFNSALEEAKILWNRQPVEDLLENKGLDPLLRERLILAQRVREYSRDVLGLKVDGSYTSYSRRGQKRLVTLISAAPKAELKPYTWWFPFTGRVPYKGFFQHEQALSEAKDLEGKGYDVYVTESDAFSTLGWFNDPIQSQFLRYDRVSYVDLLIHELFHGTVYVPGKAEFNESAATFAGHRGSIGFFEWSEGSESTSHARAIGRWMDSLKFSGFLEEILDRLNFIYRADIPLDEKLRQKQEIFARSTEDFKVLQRTLRVKNYGFLRLNLNNAVLLHYWLYHRELNLFEKVYAASGGDLGASLGRIQECGKDRDDPFQKLREFASFQSDGGGGESPSGKDLEPISPGSAVP